MNSVLQREKQKMGKTHLTIPEFAKLLQAVVERQRTEENLALTGIGDQVHLDQNYESYRINETAFYRKTKEQQNTFLDKFHNANVSAQRELPAELSSTLPKEDSSTSCLSISLNNMKLIGVPFATLVRMYNDASTLARSKNRIVKAPGEGDNQPRYVANSISNLPPYQVSQKRTTRNSVYYECSEGCIRFSAYALCEHTLAVADIDNRLSDFLKAYKMKNGGKRDLNTIVHTDMPAGRRRKKTKENQPKNVKERQIEKSN